MKLLWSSTGMVAATVQQGVGGNCRPTCCQALSVGGQQQPEPSAPAAWLLCVQMGFVRFAAFSADSRFLITSSNDCHLSIWDVAQVGKHS